MKALASRQFQPGKDAIVRAFSVLVKTSPKVRLQLYLGAFDMESSAESVLKSGLGFRIWM